MIEFILEILIYIFVEIIFEGIILGFIKSLRYIGLLVLKIVTLSNRSLKELSDKYQNSSKLSSSQKEPPFFSRKLGKKLLTFKKELLREKVSLQNRSKCQY